MPDPIVLPSGDTLRFDSDGDAIFVDEDPAPFILFRQDFPAVVAALNHAVVIAAATTPPAKPEAVSAPATWKEWKALATDYSSRDSVPCPICGGWYFIYGFQNCPHYFDQVREWYKANKPRRKKAKKLRPGDVLADGYVIGRTAVRWGYAPEVAVLDARIVGRTFESRDEWVDLAPEVQS